MTLILTSVCKDGICVCADKRYKKTDNKGVVRLEDNHYKIHSFQKIPYVILNHGINEIYGKDWKIYCQEYEDKGSWIDKNHLQIVDDFKEYVEEYVKKELERYRDVNKHAVGFLLGGKPPSESNYKVSEIHWLLENDEIKFTPPDVVHTRKKDNLILTGNDDAKAYLKEYIESNKSQYSKISKVERAEKKLIKTFRLAVKAKQKSIIPNEFSDGCDIEVIDGN